MSSSLACVGRLNIRNYRLHKKILSSTCLFFLVACVPYMRQVPDKVDWIKDRVH